MVLYCIVQIRISVISQCLGIVISQILFKCMRNAVQLTLYNRKYLEGYTNSKKLSAAVDSGQRF